MVAYFSDLATLDPDTSFDDDAPPDGDALPDRNPQASPSGQDPPTSTGPTCEICGVEIPYKGRGRKPTRCQDHPRTRNPQPKPGKPESPLGLAVDPDTKRRLDAVRDDLMFGVGQIMGPLAPFAPVTAATLGLTAPDGIDGCLKIAAEHPRMLDGLEAAAKVIPYVAIAKFAMALALAIAVDMGRVMPQGAAAEYLKVAEAAQAVNWQPPRADVEGEFRETSQPNSNAMPPRFNMPGPIKVR